MDGSKKTQGPKMKYKKHKIERTRTPIATTHKVFGEIRQTIKYLVKVTSEDGSFFYTTSVAQARREINFRVREEAHTAAAAVVFAALLLFAGCAPPQPPRVGTVCVDAQPQKPLRLRRWIPGSAAGGYPLLCADYEHACDGNRCEALPAKVK